MQKLTNQNLHIILSERLNDTDFVLILNALIKFLRRGGKKKASERFDLILSTLKQDDALCRQFSLRFYTWLSKVHIYPALIKLGIFSRHSFTREMGIRIYERFSPSYKDFSNLREVFLYLFHSENDDKWLQTLSLRQWLGMYELLLAKADPALLQTASRQLTDARLRAVEMLSIWIASEAIEPDLIRIAPVCWKRILHLSLYSAKWRRWWNIIAIVKKLMIRHTWRLCLTSVKIKLTICAVAVREQGLVRQ